MTLYKITHKSHKYKTELCHLCVNRFEYVRMSFGRIASKLQRNCKQNYLRYKFSTKSSSSNKQKLEICPKKSSSSNKKSFWKIFKSKPDQVETNKQEQKEKSSPEECKEYELHKHRPDPDFSSFAGATAFRTCGTAYVLQQDRTPKLSMAEVEKAEEKILSNLERPPELKNIEDPMPHFESVEQRLLALSEKKLHPLYKKYMSTPKKPPTLNPKIDPKKPQATYKSRSGPVESKDIPAHLKVDKSLLDKKNIFADFKRIEPPRQLLGKMLEIEMNQKPTMEKKATTNDDAKKKLMHINKKFC